MLETTIAAVLAFTATNLDDLALLLLWFGQARSARQVSQVVVGQYLGFLALLIASLPGFFGGQLIARPWLGWLGLLPILIGGRALFSQDDEENQSIAAGNRSWVIAVALTTIANGADNIGIYIPLFASQTWWRLGLTISIFLGLVALWCGGAFWLARHPKVAPRLDRYSRLVPIVLIGLGLYIFVENRAWRVFGVFTMLGAAADT
jgi:cadmium resistance transport/sequestration family protein